MFDTCKSHLNLDTIYTFIYGRSQKNVEGGFNYKYVFRLNKFK